MLVSFSLQIDAQDRINFLKNKKTKKTTSQVVWESVFGLIQQRIFFKKRQLKPQ